MPHPDPPDHECTLEKLMRAQNRCARMVTADRSEEQKLGSDEKVIST